MDVCLISVFAIKGNDPLMRQVYEIDVPSSEALGGPPTHPLLWRYRIRVTIEHLIHTFEEEVASDDPTKCRLLAKFLSQVRQEGAVLCCARWSSELCQLEFLIPNINASAAFKLLDSLSCFQRHLCYSEI